MAKRRARRVLLIGWDAADWQMIQPLLDGGQMPNLQRFIEQGVMGKLATLHPVLSPILWNSIATGKRADKHGILGFIEPDGRGHIRPVASTSRQAKAIWNILSQNGLRSCVLGWFASHPAEPINGVVVSDRYQRSTNPAHEQRYPLGASAVHPPALLDTLKALRVSINDITPQQVLPFVPQAERIRQPEDRRLAALCQLLAECATMHNAATHLLEHETWDFAAVYYDAIDHFGHAFMEYHPPKMEHVSDEDFELYRHVMSACYCFHDLLLGRLLELVGPDTTVVLLSDHGYYSGALRPWLRIDPNDPNRKIGPGVNPVAWHRRYGVLAVRGPGIKQDDLVHGASLLDIAPTVLTMLGLPVPNDMDGTALTQIFSEPVAPEHVDTYEGEHPNDGVHRDGHVEDPYEAQEVLRQLAALGYIEAPDDDQARAVDRCIRDRKQNLAQVHFAAGRLQEAHDLLRELLQREDQPQLRSRLALCLVGLQRHDEAEDVLGNLGAQPEVHPLAAMLQAEVLFARGAVEDALRMLEAVRKIDPRLPHLHVHIGRIYLQQQRWAEAEDVLRKALEIDGDDAEAHDFLGVALAQQGQLEDAVYRHMCAASLQHHRPLTHINLGMALAKLNQVDWAIQAFKVAAGQAPDQPLPHEMLARLYRQAKGDTAAAREHEQLARRLSAQRGQPDQSNGE